MNTKKVDYREIETWIKEQMNKPINAMSDSRHITSLIFTPSDKVYHVYKNGEEVFTTTDCEKAVERYNEINFY